MKELIGKTLNRYKITQLLGEGGMGAVFKAQDLTLQRDVAVKVMHPHFARQPNFRERFLQEARTAARMDHPGIMQVYDFGQDQEILYIIMEFIPGNNLQNLLRDMKSNGQWIRLDEAVNMLRQVALALDYAHRQGVLHRDIKPANIMLKPDAVEGLPYRPVITDLGLARLLDGARMTQEGTSMGTPVYMSPEQALGETSDNRSDVYSLGVLLFELVVGHPPFPIRNLSDAVRYHTKEPPPSPRSLRPEIPEDLEKAILFALEKKPENRLRDAGALAEALKRITPALDALATAVPTVIESSQINQAVSLMTQMGQDPAAGRGASILQEFESPEAGSGDSIQIMGADKKTMDVLFKGKEMTIGRSDENDIPLPSNSVSRHHARITFDGSRYQIIDLNSTNGTYLGQTRLLPGVPENWSPEVPVRMGEFFLKLVQAKPAASDPSKARTGLYSPPAGTVAGTFVASQVQQGGSSTSRIGVVVEDTGLTIQPGQAGTLVVILLNQGPVVDHFLIQVEGVPETWVPTMSPVQLMPGGQQQVRLAITPPRAPESKAGRYNLRVRAISQDNPKESATATTAITVAPFYRLTAELYPQKIRTGKPARMTIKNLGNTREVFKVRFRDRADELVFHPDTAEVQVPPGGSGAAEFRPELGKRYWFGASKSHPFNGEIATAQGESQNLSGEAVSTPIIPLWMIPVAMMLCVVLLAAGGYLLSDFNSQTAQATQSIQATQTEVARLALLVDTDGDGLTDIRERELGTVINSADSDADGLSDKAEVEGVTDPLNPDTDGDGLNDGEEKIWKTDPNAPDTDGDTLSDGQEVKVLNTSPINLDTDGDGMNDNVDPDPGKLPTLTPTPTITPSPTPTIVPTATIPADGVSLNCDGTYQRLSILDAGGGGKTITVDNLVNGSWKPVWAISSGNPMDSQLEDDAGLYRFGDCRQLLVVPLRFTGSGAALQLAIYKWNGSTMEQVLNDGGIHGTWFTEQNRFVSVERSVYLFGEPNSSPCNKELVGYRWNGDNFVDDGTSITPTYSGTPPTECQAPTPTIKLTFFIMPPIIIVTPLVAP